MPKVFLLSGLCKFASVFSIKIAFKRACNEVLKLKTTNSQIIVLKRQCPDAEVLRVEAYPYTTIQDQVSTQSHLSVFICI